MAKEITLAQVNRNAETALNLIKSLNVKIDGIVQIISGTIALDHNLTLNKQGGTTGEYYHLTAAEYAGTFAHGMILAGGLSVGDQISFTKQSSLSLFAPTRSGSDGDGFNMTLRAGTAHTTSGSYNGGNIFLYEGLGAGSGHNGAVQIARSDGYLGFFDTTGIIRNNTGFTLNSGSLSFDLPAVPSAQQVGDCLRQLLMYLGNISGMGLCNVSM